MSQSVTIRPDENGNDPSFHLSGSDIDFIARDFSSWQLRHVAQVTTASGTYESEPLDVPSVSRICAVLQSNNNGTFLAMYTFDKTVWFATTVTGVLDPDNGRYNFEWIKDAPVIQVKYKYTETASVGLFTGGFAITEKVGT